jgi:hypothetical protein
LVSYDREDCDLEGPVADDDLTGTGERHASTCRWARQTVLLPYPAWLEAEDHPWSCMRLGEPRLLESTEPCETCPHWMPKRLAVDPPVRD